MKQNPEKKTKQLKHGYQKAKKNRGPVNNHPKQICCGQTDGPTNTVAKN